MISNFEETSVQSFKRQTEILASPTGIARHLRAHLQGGPKGNCLILCVKSIKKRRNLQKLRLYLVILPEPLWNCKNSGLPGFWMLAGVILYMMGKQHAGKHHYSGYDNLQYEAHNLLLVLKKPFILRSNVSLYVR